MFKTVITITDINTTTSVGMSQATAASTANVGPLLTIAPVMVIVPQGTTATNVTLATFTDAAPNEPVSNFVVTVNWGDGTATSTGMVTLSGTTYTITGSHTFVAPGRYTIGLSIVDNGGPPMTANTSAVVGNLDERFVAQVFRDLLNRQVDTLGLAFWTGELSAGMTHSQVVLRIEQSMEYRIDEVEFLYNKYLHRVADASGLNNFVNFLMAGGTVEEVSAAITGSPEYFNSRGGGTNSGFLTALYQDALGRAVDSAGGSSFMGQLNSGVSRQQVAMQIFTSMEYFQDLVDFFYVKLYHRHVDASGSNTFVTFLQSGGTDEQTIAFIAGSQEYSANL
jgi:hypothetical protein